MSPIDPRDLGLLHNGPAETGERPGGRRDVSARLERAAALACDGSAPSLTWPRGAGDARSVGPLDGRV
ncbi:hypothetical protein DLJ49_10445 [Rhodovulum sp. 12E13]|uniref:hypothetical protein n=1 Tax=Rhodovulum sp. 12E13 TaxID=2203891 RepID=UPI000E18F95E|nr:hypothetical protein [Rhodovulum sp. 12E13]RDC72627.1 hypothetical protein DLJ49_10445 [Rhodovulum sp. 12E13]